MGLRNICVEANVRRWLVVLVCCLCSRASDGASLQDVNKEHLDPSAVPIVFDAVFTAWNTNLLAPASGNSLILQFDPATGLPRRLIDSLGPTYTARATTVGDDKLVTDIYFYHVSWDMVDGVGLKNGELTFPISTPFGPGVATSSLRSKTDAMLLSATYGLSDDVDLSVLLPVVRTELDGENTITVGGFVTSQTFGETGAGIGDIGLDIKWLFYNRERIALGASAKVFLPTGDRDDFLGYEAWRVQPAIYASTKGYPVNLHVNLGLDVGDNTDATEELRYKVAVDRALSGRFTVFVELLGRVYLNNDRLSVASTTLGRPIDAKDHAADGVAGLKFKLAANAVLIFNTILRLDKTGERGDLSMIGGLEIAF